MRFLYKRKSFGKLTVGLKSLGGRSSHGNIGFYHRGNGLTRKYRVIDYVRYLWNIPGLVIRLEYNPSVNNILALISYSNGILAYIPCPQGLRVGHYIQNRTFYIPNCPGTSFDLRTIPTGTFIHYLEQHCTTGAQLLRSLGAYGRIMGKIGNNVLVKLKSGCIVSCNRNLVATSGVLLPDLFEKKIHHKAGFFRNRGRRPSVRGVAMNPIDHPHGGGEGKSSGGRPSVSRWGWLTKNVKKTKV